MAKNLSFDDAVAVIKRLAVAAVERGESLGSPIVLVGGTAMAAWNVRAYSNDVDLFVTEVPAEAVEAVEAEFRAIYGPTFRLDVTSGENVWGQILVRDIATSPTVGRIDATHELRALCIEDLFLLKLASARTRDLEDLDLLAPSTTSDKLVVRWNQLIKWHGDRHAILGFADALVIQLARLYQCDAATSIGRLEITVAQRELLAETHVRGRHGAG